jgi:hypothetical protein
VERDALLTLAVATTVAAAWRAASTGRAFVVAALATVAVLELGAAAFLPWPPWARGPLALHASSIVGKLAALGREAPRAGRERIDSTWRVLAYGLLWPGLDLDVAFRLDPASTRPARLQAARAMGLGVIEVAASFGLAWGALAVGAFGRPEPIPAWLRCASFVLLLDGAFRATAGALRSRGFLAEDLFRDPWASRDLAEFWGRRWNRFIGRTIALDVYAPVKARVGRVAAVLAAFFMSGVFHELLFGLPAWSDGRYVAFFLAHGVATLALGALVAGRRGRRPGKGRRLAALALSWAVLLATAPLFFGGPYAAVLPIERARP